MQQPVSGRGGRGGLGGGGHELIPPPTARGRYSFRLCLTSAQAPGRTNAPLPARTGRPGLGRLRLLPAPGGRAQPADLDPPRHLPPGPDRLVRADPAGVRTAPAGPAAPLPGGLQPVRPGLPDAPSGHPVPGLPQRTRAGPGPAAGTAGDRAGPLPPAARPAAAPTARGRPGGRPGRAARRDRRRPRRVLGPLPRPRLVAAGPLGPAGRHPAPLPDARRTRRGRAVRRPGRPAGLGRRRADHPPGLGLRRRRGGGGPARPGLLPQLLRPRRRHLDQRRVPALDRLPHPRPGHHGPLPQPPPAPEALELLLGAPKARLLALLDEPTSTTELAARLGVTPGAVSQHLTVLHATRLVTRTRSGRLVLYARSPLGDQLRT
ncbi:ArsR/SmtB family transcription factor [Kitasatospora gansuensis]